MTTVPAVAVTSTSLGYGAARSAGTRDWSSRASGVGSQSPWLTYGTLIGGQR